MTDPQPQEQTHRARHDRAVAYPLGQPQPATRAERRALDQFWQRCAEHAVTRLGPLLQAPLRLHHSQTFFRSHARYHGELTDAHPRLLMPGACVTAHVQLWLALYERLLGGNCQYATDRELLTDLETALLLSAMRHAWSPIVSLERSPYNNQLGAPSDLLCVGAFELRTPFVQGSFDVALPWQTFRATLRAPEAPRHFDPSPMLGDCKVQLSIRLGRAEILFRDLMGLEPGDTIMLDQRVAEPVPICVNHNAQFLGVLGRRDGRLAARITGPVEADAV